MKIVIVGTGGHAREIANLFLRVQTSDNDHKLIGFLDENQELHGQLISNFPVLGGMNWVSENHDKCSFICAIGNSSARRDVVNRLNQMGVKWAKAIDPDVYLSDDDCVGEGAMIFAGTRMTTNIKIGRHSIANMGCTLSHDVVLGDFTTLACGVHLSGNVKIGEGTELGVGVNVIQGVSIGEWSVIGAGAAVIGDVPPHVTAVGVPAKVIKENRRSRL